MPVVSKDFSWRGNINHVWNEKGKEKGGGGENVRFIGREFSLSCVNYSLLPQEEKEPLGYL